MLALREVAEIAVLSAACICAFVAIASRRYTRSLVGFTLVNTFVALFFALRRQWLLGILTLLIYIGAICAYAIVMLNIAGTREVAPGLRSPLAVLVALLVVIALLCVFLPTPPVSVSEPHAVPESEVMRVMWSVEAPVILLLGLLLFFTIVVATLIARSVR